MQLPLPAIDLGAQLLRGRFQAEAAPEAHQTPSLKLSLRFDPIFDHRGRRVGVPLLDDSGVMVFNVAPNASHQRAKPKRHNWARGSHPLAVAFSSQSCAAVLMLPEHLNFWQRPEIGMRPRPPKSAFDATTGGGSLMPLVWSVDDQRQHRAFVVDAAGRLVSWTAPHPQAKPRGEAQGPDLVDKDVLAMAAVDDAEFVYVSRDVGRLWVRFAGHRAKSSQGQVRNLIADPGAQAKVFLSGGYRWQHGFGACAVRLAADDQGERWRVIEAPTSSQPDPDGWQVQLPPGTGAVGLVKPRSEPGYALVVQSIDRCAFSMQSPARVATIWRSPVAVERVAVCPNTGLIAMLTRDRELFVYSTHDQALRFAAHGHTASEAAA